MFNRNAKRFTDIYTKEPERFGFDDYAAKWLTEIYNPEFSNTIRISFSKDKPRIGDASRRSWHGARSFLNAEEVF